MSDFESYMELRHITQWKDDAVYRTEIVEVAWFDHDDVQANHPAETNMIYSTVSADFPTFRRKRR